MGGCGATAGHLMNASIWHLPCGWCSISEVAGTVALFPAVNSTVQAADKKPAASLGSLAVVAPIFEHSDGRTGVGPHFWHFH